MEHPTTATALKKYHSLDHSARELAAGSSGGHQASSTSTPTTTTTTTRRPTAPLMHSVSIVVELARESIGGHDDDDTRQAFGSTTRVGDQCETPKASPTSVGRKIDDVRESDESVEAAAANNQEDEDDDDDDCEGLSSDLARKVVIVDEADKILHTRAASAESAAAAANHCCCCCCSGGQISGAGATTAGRAQQQSAGTAAADGAAPRGPTRSATTCSGEQSTGSERSTNQLPPRLPERALAGLRSSTIERDCSGEWRHRFASVGQRMASLAGETCRSEARSSEKTDEKPPPPPGVAEHGELTKLSMRRYTHHSLNLAGGGGHFAINHSISGSPRLAPRDQISSTAQLGDGAAAGREGEISTATTGGSAALALARSNTIHQQQQQQPGSPTAAATRDWSQRRQSLQISLLSHYHHHHHHHHHHQHYQHQQQPKNTCHCCSSAPGKSLTEEEFRGEREFNEQLRQAKSPEAAAALYSHRNKSGVASGYFAPSSPSPPPPPLQPDNSPNTGGRRCHSVAESEAAITTASGNERADDSHSRTGRGQSNNNNNYTEEEENQTERRTRARSQRRVSFGSIDPIPRSFLSSDLHKKRASFAALPAQTIAAVDYHHQQQQRRPRRLEPGDSDDQEDNNKGSQALRSAPPLAPPLPLRSFQRGAKLASPDSSGGGAAKASSAQSLGRRTFLKGNSVSVASSNCAHDESRSTLRNWQHQSSPIGPDDDDDADGPLDWDPLASSERPTRHSLAPSRQVANKTLTDGQLQKSAADSNRINATMESHKQLVSSVHERICNIIRADDDQDQDKATLTKDNDDNISDLISPGKFAATLIG